VSGPWPTDIPVVALRHVAEIQLGKMLQPRPGCANDALVEYLKAGSLPLLDLDELPTMFASSDEQRNYGVHEGDLLVAEGGDIGRTAFVGSSPAGAIIQNSLHRLRIREGVDLRFLRYSLDAIRGSGWLDVLCNKATFAHLTSDKLGSLPIPLRSEGAQRSIADYLDDETARIDALIEKKRRMIDLLEERHGTYVARTVLGVASGLPLKPSSSGIYGFVPLTWPETSLRHLNCEVQTGPFGSQLHAEEYVEGGWPVVNPMNLIGGTISSNAAMTVATNKRAELSRHVLREGDIVLGRRGAMGRAGLVTATEAGWLCGTGSLRLRLNGAYLLPEYMKLLLETLSARAYFELVSVGSTMDNLNSDIVLDFPTPLPPLDDQERIIVAVAAMAKATSSLRGKLEVQMELSQERRQALITAAVTGELDVGGRAA
jgi:type I restriction enzyme S subunit